ncbi:hypothetical protein D2E26_0988 [Bifidobacterium dolichotidis]|uniref:Uncharacterized protein n=1 Tax=Bifidobacterium dolichotidis TaxID=2306976 RepID=A0A430FQ59_9BIFI|nr:hypothetical protein D2E26_0988 [Bifidobacterium dolichotidis]
MPGPFAISAAVSAVDRALSFVLSCGHENDVHFCSFCSHSCPHISELEMGCKSGQNNYVFCLQIFASGEIFVCISVLLIYFLLFFFISGVASVTRGYGLVALFEP